MVKINEEYIIEQGQEVYGDIRNTIDEVLFNEDY